MNNIYKVIWSKAKNCYVVASEIARSHTKSATGSEKIGGVTRRSLLASLMALSFLCGGLGVASASLEVVDQSGTAGTVTIYTKDEVDNALTAKGSATDVASNRTDIDNLKTAVGGPGSGLTKDVADQKADIATNRANINNLDGKLANLTTTVSGKADEAAVTTALDSKANTDLSNLTADGETKIKNIMSADMEKKANKDTVTALGERVGGVEGKVTALEGKVGDASSGLVKDVADLKTQGTTLTNALGNKADQSDLDAAKAKITTNETNITALQQKTTQISYDPAKGTTVNEVDFKAAEVDAHGKRLTGVTTLNTTGDATVGGAVNATGKVSGKGLDAGTEAITGGSLGVTGAVTGSSVNAGTLSTTGDATVGGNLKVTGTITTDRMVFGDKATNNYTEIDQGHITSKNDALASDATKKSSSMELDHSKLEVGVADKNSNGHLTMTADQTSIKNSDLDEKNYSEIVADKDSVTTTVKDEKGNTTSTKSSATEIRNYAKDKDGNKTNNVQTATQNKSWAKDKDGNESSIVQTGKDITNTAQNGTITNDAQNIVNKASENITTTAKTMNTTVSGQATESYGGLETTVNGNETHTVTGIKTENVTGKVTENYKAGQATNVTGDQDITVSGKQTNKIYGNQENIIGGSQTTTVTGDISNTAKNITNDATETLTDKVGTNTRVTTSTSITDTVGTANRKIEDGKITDTAGDSTVTTENGKGTTFAKAGSAAYSTKAGAPTDTNIAGNLITTGRVDANELGVSDKDGANSADLSVEAGEGKGVKASAGNGTTTGSLDVKADEVSSSVKDASGKGSTFKQRIDAIMMESKDVSIKAEEKLTNEAKVITNKASEVINNEAVNINNTATGIITSKASEIKNQADKLISNKVGENTWENMEDGKITTSIKDGTKQNLTQSDAAGTTQSTVDGVKSTVTIQNADGLTDVVTDGKNTSIQNQTASAIQAAVKDKAGNENASLTDVTTSANTIKNGTKANTVISTADGTSFINSEAAAPVTGASGAGTHLNTTIKGNTITTGKVTMDYADVMKDLGVKGNTTLGEAGKDTTLTVNSKATFNNGLTVTNGETKLKNTTIEGTLNVFENATFQKDVTANSFSVNGKTYIDSDGLNANNQVIRNVADGSISEGSKDAVNGGQLYTVKNDLEGKVNKVGANAAAMANLHPMEFDPDSKWNIAAAIGNYGSETAAALGAFYRPNDDVMVNLSTAFGTGENMVGGGVSVRLGKGGNKLSREESNALKDQVNDLTARMDALLSVLNPNMSKDFPDVPENHWAYEAVSRLAGNDIVQGYPDGEFHGERTMTRYEMAEIIYNALSRGAEAEKELVEEFKPELQAMAASEKATAERAEG